MDDGARLVTPLERLMYQRSLPLFGSLPASELAVLAEYARERHFRRGHALLREGEPTPSIFLLVEGEVQLRRRDHTFRMFRGHDAVGVMALLARLSDGVEATAQTNGIALELEGDALYDIFEDHFSILEHVLSATARILRTERARLGTTAGFPRAPRDDLACPERPLDVVERILVLRRILPFAEANVVALAELARRCEERRFEAGTQLWQVGARSDHTLLLVCGLVRCESDHQSFRLGSGDAVGVTDLLARERRAYAAVTDTPGVALSIDREALLDVFEDHFEIATDCLAVMAQSVLEVFRERAADGEVPVGLPLEVTPPR